MPNLLFVDDDAHLLAGLKSRCPTARVNWAIHTVEDGPAAQKRIGIIGRPRPTPIEQPSAFIPHTSASHDRHT